MYGILIVDDNSLVRMSLVNLISWKQHNATLVAIAHDGNEAFRLCEERLPHIVITDIKMPGCDGITLMQKIHRYYPMIQVIAISAHGVFEYAKQAMQAGCLNYILKPISGEELNESIASAIAVIQSRGGRTDEDLYNLYEYALNSYLSSTEKYCAVFLAGWELPTTEEIESICATKYSGQILKAPTQYFQTFLLIFEKNDVLDNLKKITNALVARDGCRYVIEPIPEAVLIDEVGSYFVGIKKKVALTAFWAGNLVVHDERFILEKLEDEVKIYWSLIDYQGMANALMKRLDRSDIRDFSAMRKNKKLIEDYLRLLMTICLSRFDEVCELMFISQLEMAEVSVIIPTLSWVAEQAGMVFEAYLGSERDGLLFAKTGSTVLGGNHFQQFNYLNAYYDIYYFIYGTTSLFDSSIRAFSKNVIVRAKSIREFYCGVQDYFGLEEEKVVLFDTEYINDGTTSREFLPYFYPEVLFHQAWGYIGQKENFLPETIISEIPPLSNTIGVETLSAEIAHRYEKQAKGVAFGDPDAILSMMATLCRDKYVALYGAAKPKKLKDIEVSSYTEQYTCAMEDIKQLTKATNNNVLVGRQIGDGDLFEWGKHGICIKIMDPNRPAFPSVSTIPYQWANTERCWDENEPSDEQLMQYAQQGKILSTLVWHSGEMAHNEAMINLMELASFTGIKMGIGVHAARYQTCPQLWELLSVERSQGGVWGLIEPILHCGGMGVMAECGCPPEALKQHCVRAMKEIEEIAGKAGMPKGYMAFMDTDLKTLTQLHPELYQAVEEVGLDYYISSALPGRNRILYQGKSMVAFNLTPRNVCAGSPYVRMSVMEDIVECERTAPGWIMGVLDSPVVSFTPYIWNRGSKFMEIVNWMVHGETINVLPHTISRYTRILKKMGYIE